jgi:hypothetical protein
MDYNLEEVLLYIILPGKIQTVVFNMPGNVCLEKSLSSNFLNTEGLQLVNCRKVKFQLINPRRDLSCFQLKSALPWSLIAFINAPDAL